MQPRMVDRSEVVFTTDNCLSRALLKWKQPPRALGDWVHINR